MFILDGDACVEQESNGREFMHTEEELLGVGTATGN